MAADGGYASRITHTFYAFARPSCRRGPTHHVLRTRIPDSSEKWWLTGVTPHALRIRITHLHAQVVGEGLRTTYYAYVLRIPPPTPFMCAHWRCRSGCHKLAGVVCALVTTDSGTALDSHPPVADLWPRLVSGAALRRQQWLLAYTCLLYTSPSPRDATLSRMPSSA